MIQDFVQQFSSRLEHPHERAFTCTNGAPRYVLSTFKAAYLVTTRRCHTIDTIRKADNALKDKGEKKGKLSFSGTAHT
jgi:hypothetical protein